MGPEWPSPVSFPILDPSSLHLFLTPQDKGQLPGQDKYQSKVGPVSLLDLHGGNQTSLLSLCRERAYLLSRHQ